MKLRDISSLFFSFLFLLASSTSWSQTASERAEAAFLLQEAADYPAAISAYQALLSEGYGSADLHFNLGMAHHAQQQLGKAILQLEKAYRLRPYDKQISKNLALLRNEQVDGLLPIPTFFLFDWWQKVGARFSPNTWGILALLLVFLAAGVLAIRSWYTTQESAPSWYTRWQKRLLPLAALGILLAVFCILLANSRKKELLRQDQAVITSPLKVALHVAPGEDTEVSMEVTQGLKARVLDEFEGWMKLSLSDGREGWVKLEAVERI